jgi:hypothetical protein
MRSGQLKPPMKTKRRFTTAAILAFCLGVSLESKAATYYVDRAHASASDSNPGTSASPWRTITRANQTVSPGDTVEIKQGTYNEPIIPRTSGTAAQRITYRNFGTDAVLITEATRGIVLAGKSHVIVQGINFYRLDGFLWLDHATNNVIAYCNFDQMRNSGEWAGSRIQQHSRSNRVHHCQFSKWGYYTADDDIGCILDIGDEYSTADQTGFNILEDCVLFHGGHHVLGVYGSFNVVRRNYFHNENWSGDRGNRNLMLHGYDGNSGNNLIEGNRISFAGLPPDSDGAAGMGLITKKNIVRFNSFYQCSSAGVMMGITANYFTSPCFNKIYNNTFHANGYLTSAGSEKRSGIGFAIWSGTRPITSNAVVNNLFWQNPASYGAYRVNLADQRFAGNWEQTGDPLLADIAGPFHPTNATRPNFNLRAGSPCINAGVHLARVVSASGSGASFRLDDAGYFFDGWGVTDGDMIQLEGATQRARILRIDTTTQAVTLDRSISWTQNQGVSIAYEGSAPDIGAFESGGAAKPAPPTRLRIISVSD